jgi:hypothetical protein
MLLLKEIDYEELLFLNFVCHPEAKPKSQGGEAYCIIWEALELIDQKMKCAKV